MSKNKDEQLRKDIVRALRTVHDPEIPVNIYDLGLVYNIAFADAESVQILMTLTSPACPVASMLVTQVENKVETVEEVLVKVDSVTTEDIQRVAKNLLVTEKLSAAIVGPFRSDKAFQAQLRI